MFAKRTWQVCQRQTLDARSLQCSISICGRTGVYLPPFLCVSRRQQATALRKNNIVLQIIKYIKNPLTMDQFHHKRIFILTTNFYQRLFISYQLCRPQAAIFGTEAYKDHNIFPSWQADQSGYPALLSHHEKIGRAHV